MTEAPGPGWRLLTNHGLVLVMVSLSPDARISDIAAAVGITERTAQRIVSQLVEEGYLRRRRVGRRRHYEPAREAVLPLPLLRPRSLGPLLDALSSERRTREP